MKMILMLLVLVVMIVLIGSDAVDILVVVVHVAVVVVVVHVVVGCVFGDIHVVVVDAVVAGLCPYPHFPLVCSLGSLVEQIFVFTLVIIK